MKKIAFVLYANQLLSVTYLLGESLVKTFTLEKKIRDSLGDKWDITFDWEKAKKEEDLDALVVPEPFPPIQNEEGAFVINVPAKLFYNMDVEEIGRIIDEKLAAKR